MEKVCRICNLPKDIDNFYKNDKNKDGYFNECKICTNKAHKIWANNNKEKLNKKQKESRNKNPELSRKISRLYFEKNKNRILQLKKKNRLKVYNLTIEDYNKLYEEQKGLCKICGNPPSGDRWGKLNIDHNHTTGEVRGLLCSYCNIGLGKFRDNKELLIKAYNYLNNGSVKKERISGKEYSS